MVRIIKDILTTGIFFNGVMYKGDEDLGGRIGDDSSVPWQKTGTPEHPW